MYSGTSPEGRQIVFNGEKIFVNNAEFALQRAFELVAEKLKTCGAMFVDCIFVREGRSGVRTRQRILENYKRKTGEKPEALKEEYRKLDQLFCTAMRGLGATLVSHPLFEADDVIAFLAKYLSGHVVIISNDGDLLQVCDPSNGIHVLSTKGMNVNKYGEFPFRFVHLYKALVGDPSDGIPGAAGFGEKSFMKYWKDYGEQGMAIMQKLITDDRDRDTGKRIAGHNNLLTFRLEGDTKEAPYLNKVVDASAMVKKSYDVSKLLDADVKRSEDSLVWQAGIVRSKEWHQEQGFYYANFDDYYSVEIVLDASNFERFWPEIADNLNQGPCVGLDIETSTPPESDEWVASQAGKNSRNLDVLGSELTGMGLTFGDNLQYSVYMPVQHVTEHNLPHEVVRQVVEQIKLRKVIHNLHFEMTVLYQIWGEAWKDNGQKGFLTNVEDTKLMASYVNENHPLGLKYLSSRDLAFKQTSYDEVTQGRKMNAMTPDEVLAYGCDDTKTSSALFVHYKRIMDIEQTYDIYREVEIDAAYLTAQAFVDGVVISEGERSAQEAADRKSLEEAWGVCREYLISQGWKGSLFEPVDFSPSGIKKAFNILTGDGQLKTKNRRLDKLANDVRDQGSAVLADLILSGDIAAVNALASANFDADPDFDTGSARQFSTLLYETMQLPVRLRNKPTAGQMKEWTNAPLNQRGERPIGSPKADHLAILHALEFDAKEGDPRRPVLKALETIKSIETKLSLFYTPYRTIRHWKTGKVHSSLNQCQAATRRYSSSWPNVQQLPKKDKATFRRVYRPARRDHVIVSSDFSGQELRLIAEASQDEKMIACYVGDHKLDIHTLTGAEIAVRTVGYETMTYEKMEAVLADEGHELFPTVKAFRSRGKTTNFGGMYGIGAVKLAASLMITEEEAQIYLESKDAAFPQVPVWKDRVSAAAAANRCSYTFMGARRHLGEALRAAKSEYDRGRASRQAVNFIIQGSAAEMTKLAMARVWRTGLAEKYGALFMFPVHDELVFSCPIETAAEFSKALQALMQQPYGNMKTVPLESSVSIGPDFGRQYEVCNDDNIIVDSRVAHALEESRKALLAA